MTTTSIVAVGVAVLLIVAAGVVVLWIIDARRAERVAGDPERVEGQLHSNQGRRWWQRTFSHR